MRAPSELNFSGIFEELDDFLELGLGLVDAGHVVERDDRLVAEEHPRPALAEAEGLVIGALGLSHHEEDEPADHDQWQDRGQHEPEPRRVGGRLGLVDIVAEGHARRLRRGKHVREDLGQDTGDRDGVDRRLALGLHGQRVALLDDLLDVVGLNVREEL